MTYDAQEAARFYDAYGEREWTRFVDGRTSAISADVHAHYLQRFVESGDRVLDIGAGPGRFTIELARIGASVVVADLSPGQLTLNREKVMAAGLEEQVLERAVADITDLRRFAAGHFDAVVCYGGPLSYVLDRADDAVSELLRVTRPGGHLLVSVMSLVGATAGGLDRVLADARMYGLDVVDDVIRTGNLPSLLSGGHLPMHLFRWSELRALLERHGGEVVAASAASIGPQHDQDLIAGLSEGERAALVRWEIDLGAEPGAIDIGAHMIAVARKPAAVTPQNDPVTISPAGS